MDSLEGGLSYEDARKQRLEENKKRMQELGLANLSKNLSSDIAATKTTPQPRQAKLRIPKECIELRRSSRVASNPAPDYREVDADSSLGRRSGGYSARAVSLMSRKYASDESRLEATLQAETIMKELPRSNPSFVKPMLQSHVTGGFWLGLPSFFCKTYLPKKDDKVVLENEKGDEWETVFLANKAGLSGGWRGFSLDHGLVDGDALVFELVEPCRFKIHIVRAAEEAQDEDDIKEETGEDVEELEVQVHSKGKSEIGSSPKGKGKKKLDKKESDLRYSRKAQAKRKQKMESDLESESDSEENARKPEKSTKKNSSRKKKKSKNDDVEDLFEIEEDENNVEHKSSTQITLFLRAEKSRFGRASKKSMTVISVC